MYINQNKKRGVPLYISLKKVGFILFVSSATLLLAQNIQGSPHINSKDKCLFKCHSDATSAFTSCKKREVAIEECNTQIESQLKNCDNTCK